MQHQKKPICIGECYGLHIIGQDTFSSSLDLCSWTSWMGMQLDLKYLFRIDFWSSGIGIQRVRNVTIGMASCPLKWKTFIAKILPLVHYTLMNDDLLIIHIIILDDI